MRDLVYEVVRSIGASRAYNPRLAALASMPLSTEALRATGVRLARLIRSDRRPAIKCVVVDGDNTLWGGVVGEDGADHVDLALNGPGVGYREFQRYLGDLRRAGVVVALASKNDERDVWAVFERPEMVLKRADLAAWRVGWQPKSESLRQLAEELSLGLDTFVFIDDNPAELGEVGVALPQVSCIQFPADPVDWLENIERGGLLDRLPPTKEDLSRSAFYAEDRLRKDVRAVAASPEEYLAQLEIAVSVYEPRGGDVQRFAQLVNKTNQFNLNGKRRTEHELVSLLESDAMIASLVSATDKFGDYGAVGAFIVEARRDQCRLDTFVLSCRAMGRGIEEAMVAAIYEKLPQSMRLFAAVLELPRNEPARRFFAKIADGESGALQRLAWPSYVRRT